MANSNGWGDGSVNNNIGWGQGANNAIGWGKSHLNSWSGATDIDGGNPPVNSVAPALSGTAQEGQTLTCSTGTWSGSPTYTYQWKRNGSNIGSATNSTYTLVTADVGQSIKCTITATNFIGSATADSNTVTPTSSVDPDAQAFITAASITDPTQQSAINQLVLDLKGYNIWSKMKAIYPIVGGTAATHKWNLKDPRDLDVAFRMTFATGWTHSSTGMTPNGATYADTKFNDSTHFTSNTNGHISAYIRTDLPVGGNWETFIGCSTDNNGTRILTRRGTNMEYLTLTDNFSAQAAGNYSDKLKGQYLLTKDGTNRRYFKNSTKLLTAANGTNGAANRNIYLGAENYPVVTYYSTMQLAFSTIGDGLTDTEAANLYTAVQAYQTTLGRQV